MLNKKELSSIVVITLILGFVASGFSSPVIFLYTTLSVLIIILVNLLAKKMVGYYYEADVETRMWEFRRYWFKPKNKLEKPIPAGALIPLVLAAVTLGNIIWMASLVFEVKAKVYRAARRHSLYSFSEMSEFHIGVIAAAGIAANLLIAFVAYLIGLPSEMNFVNLSIIYCFFNMIPFGNLDGNKMFFGSITLWSLMAILTLIGMGYVLLIV